MHHFGASWSFCFIQDERIHQGVDAAGDLRKGSLPFLSLFLFLFLFLFLLIVSVGGVKGQHLRAALCVAAAVAAVQRE
jgi:hypothetical protein